MAQLLLFQDPRPLVERLGRDFFRGLPERPGVYLMRDAEEVVLYVGKARNLRKRLNSYRVANPDRMPRRHLRLLRTVARIELQECLDEVAALAREAELLRNLKPRFNHAGIWPSAPCYLAWQRTDAGQLVLAITEIPEAGWQIFGPRSRRSLTILRSILVRWFWRDLNPDQGIMTMPPGWVHGEFGDRTVIPLTSDDDIILIALERMLSGDVETLLNGMAQRCADGLHPFELAARQADLEMLAENLGLKAVELTSARCTEAETSLPIPGDCRRE